MNKNFFLSLLAGVALLCGSLAAHAANVDVSLDLFPTTPGNPGAGGTFSIYAKTDNPLGISAINLYLSNIQISGLHMESDIAGLLNSMGNPFATIVTPGVVNLLYGQDNANGPVLFGVGTAATSDGPDPLGDAAWNGATKIFTGNYGGGIPAFVTFGASSTDANVFANTGTPPLPAGSVVKAMNVSTVVRIAPEPAAMTIIATSLLGLVCLRRK
jgi:hypothetical protein